MLVLTRKKGEKILIGNDGEISISVLEVLSDKARIGINAPEEIRVDREEIFMARKERENESIG